MDELNNIFKMKNDLITYRAALLKSMSSVKTDMEQKQLDKLDIIIDELGSLYMITVLSNID